MSSGADRGESGGDGGRKSEHRGERDSSLLERSGVGSAVQAGKFGRAGGSQQRQDDHECGGEQNDYDGHGKLPVHGGVLT